MSKEWPYSKMSHAAAEAGGPELWIKMIQNNSYSKGASDMKKKLLVPLVVTGIISVVSIGEKGYKRIKKVISTNEERKAIAEKEAEKAEMLLKEKLQNNDSNISEDAINKE